MAAFAGIYLFYALFCGVEIPGSPFHDAAFWMEMPPSVGVELGANAACYIGFDTMFPRTGSGLPGAIPRSNDIGFGHRVNRATLARSESA